MTAFRVWVDSSDRTHVVCCTICKGAWIYLERERAELFAKQHRDAEDAAARSTCTVTGCPTPGVRAGKCRSHYNADQYQARKARA